MAGRPSENRGRKETDRTERIPVGVRKLKMNLDSETRKYLDSNGLVERWVNDEDHGQRLRDFQAGGYEFITSKGTEKVGDTKEKQESGAKIKKLVGTHRDGRPKYAYLMAIKKEWYEEDQQRKEEMHNKPIDDAIYGGTPLGVQHHGVDPSKGSTYKKNINYKP